MRRVIIESPYAAPAGAWLPWLHRWLNRRYARAAMHNSLQRGEAPLASHLLYTQPGILCDEDAQERQWGIDAGLAWLPQADATIVYANRGLSRGMRYGIASALSLGIPIEVRGSKDRVRVVQLLIDMEKARMASDGLPRAL